MEMDSSVPSENAANDHVVVLPVPESYAYLNGVVLCDITAATATEITCRTRPHNPETDGGLRELRSSDAAPLALAACTQDPAGDIAKLACWAEARERDALAECTTPDACDVAYSEGATPVLDAIQVNGSPSDGWIHANDELVFTGPGTLNFFAEAFSPCLVCTRNVGSVGPLRLRMQTA